MKNPEKLRASSSLEDEYLLDIKNRNALVWPNRKHGYKALTWQVRLLAGLPCAALIWFMTQSGYAQGPIPILPPSVVEGSGILTNAGQVNLGVPVTSNLVVTLQSSDPASVAMPASVTIPPGQSNAFFNLTVGDDLIDDGSRDVTVTAITDYSTNATVMLVIESDPDHVQFAAVPTVTDTNTSFWVVVTAVNADGSVQTNFSRSLTLTAVGLEGPLPLGSTNSGNFIRGQISVNVQVTAPGHGVRLGCREYPGQSDAFTVIPPAFYSSSQPVADIVWLQASQTLLASVPASGGVYSNRLVAIDPTTGFVTNSYPVRYNPSQIEISPGGNYLYVAVSNRMALQRFNLNTRVAGVPFALGASSNPFRFAYDFCVPPGMPDSVVVAARLQDNLGNVSIDGIYRYDSGSMVPLPSFSASGWLVESMDTGFDIALSPPLAVGDASTGTILAVNANFAGTSVTYRGGEFFDSLGNCYSSANLALLGDYPGVLDQFYYAALPEVDSVFRRVFYLTGYFNYGVTFYKLKVYDRDLFQPLFQWAMPSTTGSPTRLVRCDTNFLAYVTANNMLWFIRPEATQPPRPPADLSLFVSAPGAAPIAGSNYTFSLILSNAGPGVASVVQVTNALPVNALVAQTAPSTGTVTLTATEFVWNVSDLEAGSNATLQVTVRFNNGGWQTNTAWALGYELDPVFTNNVAALPLYVQLPQQGFWSFPLNYATEDLLYDPGRDRLLLSLTAGTAPAPTNGLAVFNPYTGLTESFTPTGVAPGKMARSDDGQFLYVSLPDAGVVQQFNLPTLTPNYSLMIGGEQIYGVQYTNYAASLAVVPGNPNSVVAWTVRHAYAGSLEYGYGIALYQNGMMASNVTASGGSWEVLFDTDSGTLFGYDAGVLQRCALDSNGVTIVQQYPTLYSSGADIKYAGGHLFNTGGEMVDYNPFQVDWLFAGAQNASAVAPDPASGRVFYLVQNGPWQINAYDVATRRLLGCLTVANVVGTPSRLIRWGTDGLAFQTTGNQLFIVRSSMVTTTAFADLALRLTGPPGTLSLGDSATFTVTVTNQGTLQATNVLITNTLSAGATVLSISLSAGTWTTNANGRAVVWSLPALDTGAQATLSYTVMTVQTGLVTAISTATTATFDPVLPNNTAVATVLVGALLGLDSPLSFQLPANDVAWSPSLAEFLVTANAGIANWGGTLLSVDPVSLAVQFQVTLGANSGRLAIACDDTVLYAGTDSGACAVTIPSRIVTNRFLINPTSPGASAIDMKVDPGNDQVVAIGSSSGITAFNGGVQLTNVDAFSSAALCLEFGDQPSPLYAYDGTSFKRDALDTNGLTVLDATAGLLPTRTAMDLAWGNGLVYSSIGRVINPFNRTLVGTLTGIPSGSRVVYDSVSGWVFYLSSGTNQAIMRAFDGATLLPAGSRTIPGVNGSLTRFIRWGVDGFAALTSSNQLVLFRSSLIPTNPPADVSVSLAHSAPPYIQGSNITAGIIISNAGPNAATGVSWSDVLPAGTVILSASSSAGTLATNSSSLTGSIPLLAAGAEASVTVTFAVPSPGIVTNQIIATASSSDPNFANNSALALLWIQPANGSSSLVSLSLTVKDLASDPTRPVLYASFGSGAGALANTVVTIDPVNDALGTPVPVGSNPGHLAVTADGQFLYVALDGSGTVQKLSLPGLTTVSSFAVPQSQTVVRMVVCPTNDDMVAIRRSPAGITSLHVAGIEQPNELTSQDLFAFVDTSGLLFGCAGLNSNVKLYQLDTGPNGLGLLVGQPGKQSNSTDLQSSGGLLFFNGGMVVNPATTRGVDLMPVPYNSVVAPDAGCGRVFYLTPTNSAWTLRAFDIAQGIEVGAVSLPALASAPQRLLRWGTDGLALYNMNSQIIILRGQLVPTNPPVDVVLSQSISPLTVKTNEAIDFTLRVTNLGPVAASGVVVTQSFSTALANVSLTASTGAATYTNAVTTWQVGDLSAGAVATLTVSGQATTTGTLTATAFAYHNLNDLFWGNNVAVGAVNVPDTNTSNTLLIRLSTRELVYDAVRDVIYASTPAASRLAGNLIAEIDPATGAMRSTLAAGSEPDQISLSDDGTYLHVALDGAMGVQRFNLVSNIADLSFGFSTNDIFYAQDLVVQPGHPNTVAASLGSYNFVPPYPSTVVAYDDGIQRPNAGGPARGLSFSSEGSVLYGYVSPGSGYGIESMALSAQGFSTRIVSGFTSVPGNLRFSNGRLYSAAGQVADPNAGVLLGTLSASGPQAIDSVGGRAFYLTQSGTSWQIRAFDLTNLQSSGTQAVFNVQGTPSCLIRCGQDRLAFLTSAGQVFVIHSPLVMTNPVTPANLAVSQVATQDFTAPVETLRFIITVTNRGPGAATDVLLAINPPSAAASLTIQIPQGTGTNLGPNYLCHLGSLAAGQSLNVLLSAVITNTAYYSNFVSVSAATPDPDPSDNTALARYQGQFFQRAQSIQTYASTARALAFDPVRQRLFASIAPSVGTNLIAWYDPESGVLLGTEPVGLTADAMRVTDDGQYLYLGASATGLVQRIELSSLNMDLSFAPLQATSVAAMAIIPGSPHSIALTYLTNGSPVTAIYDDTIARTNVVTDHPFTILTVSTDGTTLYGYANTGTGGNSPRVFRMAITDPGLQELDSGPSEVPWVTTTIMKYALGRLFFGSGDVLNPSPWNLEQPFTLTNGWWAGDIEPLPGVGLAAFLDADFYDNNLTHLGIYSISNRDELEQFDIETAVVGNGSLTSCGADRFAFIASSGLVFVRASSVASADISVHASFSTNQIMAGDPATLQIIVSNVGPYAVTNVCVTNMLPDGFDLLSATLSQGAVTTNGQTLLFALGGMGSNSNATMSLALSLNSALVGLVTNTIVVTNQINAAAIDLPDPIPFNNSAAPQLVVVPRDSNHDGIPDYWDLQYGFNPNDPNVAAEDSAGDGIYNLQKYLTGADPFVFYGISISGWKITTPSSFYLTVHAAVGLTYTLQSSSNLVEWSTVSTFLCQSTNQQMRLSFGPAIPMAFYRISTTTNPPTPILAVLNPAAIATNAPVLQIAAPPGHPYTVYVSTNLVNWTVLTQFYATIWNTQITDSSANGVPARFYRATTP